MTLCLFCAGPSSSESETASKSSKPSRCSSSSVFFLTSFAKLSFAGEAKALSISSLDKKSGNEWGSGR